MNRILKYLVMIAVAMVMTSCGTVGLLVHTAKIYDGNERFKDGDQIVSVNGEKINEENICYYYELLNKAQEWTEFEI